MIRIGLAALLLAGCSGSVDGPPPVNDPNRITIIPATATLYSERPTTFQINGGTGAYFVSSSNQFVIPVSQALTGRTFTVIPNPVSSDTPVTLTVRDTGTTPLATAELVVKPSTVTNEIVISPSSDTCAPALCAGGDAEVIATLSQAGSSLFNRPVTVDVVSGDFRIITSAPGAPEALATSVTTTSDATGTVRVRIRALSTATNQTALIRITDQVSGASQVASFVIAAQGLFVVPESVSFSGPNDQTCANVGAADVRIFGGVPPYVITVGSAPIGITRNNVPASGGSFSISPAGICIPPPGRDVFIVDAAGSVATVNVTNVPGTEPIPEVPPLDVTPKEIFLTTCNSAASALAVGGTGAYAAASGNDAVKAVMGTGAERNRVLITRNDNTLAPPAPGRVLVGVSSGNEIAFIEVFVTPDDCR